jgi:uncharacterized protein (TIGR03000 family)
MPTVSNDQTDPNSAWLTVELPLESCEVWLNGVKMAHRGLVRKYVTPPLDPAKAYIYNLKVAWQANGKKHTYEVAIDLKAGDEIYHKVAKNGRVAEADVPMPKEKGAEQKADPAAHADAKLKLAMALWDAGKVNTARERFVDIIERFPDSDAAKKAREMLVKR